MNTFFAIVAGGVMLAMIGWSISKLYNNAARMGRNDFPLAIIIPIIIGLAFVAGVLLLR